MAGLPKKGWLFPRLDGKEGHVTPHLISVLANRFLRSIDAPQSFHSLRHRYGSEALRAAGGNLRIAQELLGHANIANTVLYTQVTNDEMIAAVSRMAIVA